MTFICDGADAHEQWLDSQAEHGADVWYEEYRDYCADQEERSHDLLMREEYMAETDAEAYWAGLLAQVERGFFDEYFDDDAS